MEKKEKLGFVLEIERIGRKMAYGIKVLVFCFHGRRMKKFFRRLFLSEN